ncbi:phage tail protein [Latilactobacillus curvatus]|uniref:phage tail protein n=1 Tax=Latilactobacillus curvatus TaxID=28038 RepID=UPI00207445E9|nr:phage tail protein [Latilactobacillus curvatus]MCM6843955.1 phage tail protein [Latilactobacillus curvatus]MCM6861158.1 phage tail protein [Latilactobacillus curvatus]MCM6868456.1 phage tail protein [Latilactobacillus curvatus]
MELETLEVYIDANLSRINEQLEKIYPAFEKVFSRVEQITGASMDKTEKSMDISKGSNKLIDEVKKINENMSKQFDNMSKNAESSMSKTGDGMAKGMAASRVKVGKEVDQLVNNVNSKMDQARAIQQKVSYLQNKKAVATSSGNPLDAQKFDAQVASAEARMTRYQNQAKALAAEMQSEFDAIPASLNKIAQTMDQNEAAINRLKANIKSLRVEQADAEMPTGNFTDGFGSKATAKSSKLGDQAAKQEAKMAKLIAQNDSLGSTYAKVEDRSSALKGALGKLNTELDKSAVATKRTNNSFSSMKNHLSELGNKFSFLGNGSNNLNRVASSAEKSRNSMSGLARTVRMLGSQLVVFTLMYQGIMMLASGLGSALMTNARFAASFNQIKVNLLTAFYPIYTAALPAINALMDVLVKATGYIAQFTSALFGMSRGAAKQGAAGLYNQVRAINDTGSASKEASKQVRETNKQITAANKKAAESAAAANEASRKQMQETKKKAQELKGALMGFDEINTLSSAEDNPDYSYDKQKPDKQPLQSADSLDDVPGTNFNIPDGAQFGGAIAAANEFKKILADLFKPMQEAWDKYGKRVTDAWEYALREVGGLIKAIGKSFMEVWTNGTGAVFIGNILKLLSDVLNIIGDIAKAFKDAWNDGGRGTKLIQTIFDAFNSILNLLHSIATSFRSAWNDGTGQAIAANLLDIFTNIFKTIGNLADQFNKAWNAGNVGKSIFSGILGIVNVVLDTLKKMTGATADWAKTLDFRPLLNSVDGLLKAIQPLTKNIGDGLFWFYKNVLLPLASFTITKLIPTFLDALSGAIKLLNGIIEALKPAGKWLFDSFLKPIAQWTGGVVVSVLGGIGKALGVVGDWISKHSEGFSNFVIAVAAFATALKAISMVQTAVTVVSGIMSALSGIGGITGALSLLGSGLGGIVTLLGGPFALAIAAAIAVGVLLWKNWDTVKEKAGQLGKWIGEKWNDIKVVTEKVWNGIMKFLQKWGVDILILMFTGPAAPFILFGKYVSEHWDSISKSTSKVWNDVKTAISDKAKEAFANAKKHFGDLKDAATSHFENLRKSAADKFENIRSSISSKANSAKDGALNAWATMRNNTSPYFDSIKSSASNAFDNVANWAGNLGGRMASGLSNGIGAIKNAARGIANAIVSVIGSAVNGVIDGVKWILNHVGASGAAGGLYHWSIPNFATGGTHRGGPALVNDQAGSIYQEAYQLPTGKIGIFPKQRNIIANMPAGTKIMNATNTAKLMQSNIPHYAWGIGNFTFPRINFPDFSNMFSGLGGAWSSVVDTAESIFDDVTHPGRVLDYAINKFTSYSGLEHPALDVAQGSVGKIKDGALGMVKKALEEFSPEPTGSSGVQRWAGVIRKALTKNGLPSNGTYTNAWLRQVQTESGGNEHAMGGNDGLLDGNAQGLLQVKPGTFAAYKFPGYGNIMKGYHNALAGIHYAKARYGSDMLGVIGRGHGYANGGPIFKHGLYEMGEGNNQEMVLPLTNRSRAWELMQQASEMMGFGQLQLPEVLSREDNFSSNFDLSNGNNTQTGGVGTNNVLSVIAELLSNRGNDGGQQATVEQPLILELNDDVLGRTVIKVINKEIKRTGKIPLNI